MSRVEKCSDPQQEIAVATPKAWPCALPLPRKRAAPVPQLGLTALNQGSSQFNRRASLSIFLKEITQDARL